MFLFKSARNPFHFFQLPLKRFLLVTMLSDDARQVDHLKSSFAFPIPYTQCQLQWLVMIAGFIHLSISQNLSKVLQQPPNFWRKVCPRLQRKYLLIDFDADGYLQEIDPSARGAIIHKEITRAVAVKFIELLKIINFPNTLARLSVIAREPVSNLVPKLHYGCNKRETYQQITGRTPSAFHTTPRCIFVQR